MNVRALAVVVASLALCGCSSDFWDKDTSVADLFGYNADDDAAPPNNADSNEAPATLVATPPQADRSETFCKGLADTERWKSANLGASAEVQRENADNAYRQCMDGSGHWLD